MEREGKQAEKEEERKGKETQSNGRKGKECNEKVLKRKGKYREDIGRNKGKRMELTEFAMQKLSGQLYGVTIPVLLSM